MKLTNNQMAFLAILFMIISLVCNSMIYQKASTTITGKSTATANLRICLNHPPVLIIDCDDAIIGFQYTCDIDATEPDNAIIAGSQTLTFSDNSTLFDMNPSTGLIQFTPASSQEGNYTITITVEDNSTCTNSISSDTFNLTISEFYCGDGSCNGAETCSSCPGDCGACPVVEPPPAAPGGGGRGAGPGESAGGCHVDLCKIDSKILRTKEKEIVRVCFRLGYKFRITQVNENSFTMIISDTQETATIKLDETKTFDINKDGSPDSSIQLTKIQEKDIWIILKPAAGSDILCKIPIEDALVVDPTIIRISTIIGDIVEKQIIVSNIGSDTLNINIELIGLENIIKLEKDSFSLKAFQSQIFNLIIDASKKDIEPGVYNGKIIFSTENVEKEVLVIVEVETKKIAFDVKVNIPGEYKKVSRSPPTFGEALGLRAEVLGEEVLANIDIYDLEGLGKLDIQMTYEVRDTEGNTIVREKEILTIKGDVSFVKKLPLPRDIEPGQYIFVAVAKSRDTVETASDIFDVVIEKRALDYTYILLLIITILLIIGTIFRFLVYKEHKKEKEKKKELVKKKKDYRVRLIKQKIHNARYALTKLDFQKARNIYIEIRAYYNKLEDEDKTKIYKDIKELYAHLKRVRYMKYKR